MYAEVVGSNVRNWPEAGVATLRLGTSAVDVTSDVEVTESDWPPLTLSGRSWLGALIATRRTVAYK